MNGRTVCGLLNALLPIAPLKTEGKIPEHCITANVFKLQCEHLNSEIVNLWQGQQGDQILAATEFSYIKQQGLHLMKECSTEKWLLKAVKIGDCPDHFVELHLELYWATSVLKWAGQQIGCDQFLDIVCALWKLDNGRMVLEVGEEGEQSFITKVHACRESDKQSLISKVDEVLEGQGSWVDKQLATILRDRNAGCSDPSIPPDLERYIKGFKFRIYSHNLQHGRGGSCYVLKHQWVHGEEFALKLARKTSEMDDIDLKREAEIMEKCRHPYIVGVVGCWKINSKSFIMMESLKCTLTQLMKDRKRTGKSVRDGFSALEAIDYLLPIAKAMRNLHGKEIPIAHRDIKPSNIMYTGKSEDPTKLIDFGESVEFDHSNTTRKYGVAGTTGYMAPEVRDDSKSCDLLKADVFSFGMTFAELLTWKTPEENLCSQAPKPIEVSRIRRNLIDLLKRGWRPHIPQDIPVYVAFIVESCWRKSPSSRPGFGDICFMLQNAKFLLTNPKHEQELSMVSYTDSDGMDWPIPGESKLRKMLNIENEIDSEGLLHEMQGARLTSPCNITKS